MRRLPSSSRGTGHLVCAKLTDRLHLLHTRHVPLGVARLKRPDVVGSCGADITGVSPHHRIRHRPDPSAPGHIDHRPALQVRPTKNRRASVFSDGSETPGHRFGRRQRPAVYARRMWVPVRTRLLLRFQRRFARQKPRKNWRARHSEDGHCDHWEISVTRGSDVRFAPQAKPFVVLRDVPENGHLAWSETLPATKGVR